MAFLKGFVIGLVLKESGETLYLEGHFNAGVQTRDEFGDRRHGIGCGSCLSRSGELGLAACFERGAHSGEEV